MEMNSTFNTENPEDFSLKKATELCSNGTYEEGLPVSEPEKSQKCQIFDTEERPGEKRKRSLHPSENIKRRVVSHRGTGAVNGLGEVEGKHNQLNENDVVAVVRAFKEEIQKASLSETGSRIVDRDSASVIIQSAVRGWLSRKRLLRVASGLIKDTNKGYLVSKGENDGEIHVHVHIHLVTEEEEKKL